MQHKIKKGLNLPIEGAPLQEVQEGNPVSCVAILGHDYPTMKPRVHVEVGDEVKRGQLLFEDRKSDGVTFTALGAGKVKAIHRGDKRIFQSLVIELNEAERTGNTTDQDHTNFVHYEGVSPKALTTQQVQSLLSESGLWTALRMRPFSRVPSISDTCHALFITAIDTNPLAPSVEKILEGQEEDFANGVQVLSKLTAGKVFLCVGQNWRLPVDVEGIRTEIFEGKHPAGLVGTHIHMLSPVSRNRTAWHIGYQDVIAVGKLFTTGKLHVDRIVSLAGPVVTKPSLIKTRLGASVDELSEGLLQDGENRTISGSVFFGHQAKGEVFGYLNRYDNQISCLAEGRERVFFGWLRPGKELYSTIRAVISHWLPGERKFKFTTTTHGSHRAMVPIGMFERVMPLDILPTFLLRSLLVSDLEHAEQLGCLELHEEDLGICSFVCPGKEDYGQALRNVLSQIWEENA